MPVRLFVAVWPPEEVLDVLAAHPRPDLPGLRWTTSDQWHVTLRFLDRVDDALVEPLAEALADGFDGAPPSVATLGPATSRFGRSVLLAPVAGLDDLAATAGEATEALVPVTHPRPFRGHLTLARARRGASVPGTLADVPLTASWTVRSVSLVRSTLRPTGAVYDDMARFSLRPAGRGRPAPPG